MKKRVTRILTVLGTFALAGCMMDAGEGDLEVATQGKAATSYNDGRRFYVVSDSKYGTSFTSTSWTYTGYSYPYSTKPKVVTLGDSYGSGVGTHKSGSDYDVETGGVAYGLNLTDRDDQECWQENDTTPGPRRASSSGALSRFVSCKGAQVHNVYNQVTLLNAKYPGDRDRGWDNTEVILSIGGNDLRTDDGETWPKLMQDCIIGNLLQGLGGVVVDLLVKDCYKKDKNQIYNFYSVESKLKTLYRDLRTRMPNATVAVLGYPRLMRPWKVWFTHHCTGLVGVNASMGYWVDDQVVELNRRIKNAVTYMNTYYPDFDITFVPSDDYFDNGACSLSSSKQINGLKLFGGSAVSDASVHPSYDGHRQYYDALYDVLGAPGTNFTAVTTTVPTPPTGGY